MSTENTPVEQEITDDLDAFSAEFYGQNEDTPEPASPEDAKEDTPEADALEPKDDTQTDEEDALETEDETDEVEDEPEQEPAPKPKSRFQERIDELTGKAREAERREQELARRLEEAIQRLEAQNKPEATPAVETQAAYTGPDPADKNDDGTDKYPLGEFDATYIRDFMKYSFQQEDEARNIREEERRQQAAVEQERNALAEGWREKLGPAQERYPDFQEKGQNLVQAFDGIDQKYGEYLTGTLMSLEYGPDVLYYLANNMDEANKIVAMGPTKAAIAMGRIEAKFAMADAEKQVARPRVSKAPTPPPTNKGSAAAIVEIPDDTDDLDAFTAKMFKKR